MSSRREVVNQCSCVRECKWHPLLCLPDPCYFAVLVCGKASTCLSLLQRQPCCLSAITAHCVHGLAPCTRSAEMLLNLFVVRHLPAFLCFKDSSAVCQPPQHSASMAGILHQAC